MHISLRSRVCPTGCTPCCVSLISPKAWTKDPPTRLTKWARTFIGMIAGTGSQCNVKMFSYKFRRSRCGDKTILCLEPSYLLSSISCSAIGEITYLYWIRAQMYEMNDKIWKTILEDNYILKLSETMHYLLYTSTTHCPLSWSLSDTIWHCWL